MRTLDSKLLDIMNGCPINEDEVLEIIKYCAELSRRGIKADEIMKQLELSFWWIR